MSHDLHARLACIVAEPGLGTVLSTSEPAIEALDPINEIWDSVAEEFRPIRQRKAAGS
jgi:hypothetical protein